MKKALWIGLGVIALIVLWLWWITPSSDHQLEDRDAGLEKVFRGHPYQMALTEDKLYDYYLTTPNSVNGSTTKIAVFYGMGNNLIMCQETAKALAADQAVNEVPREYNCEPAN
jgi:hypothetical protein